ncbi:hypothetical protein ACFL5M_00730 [Candidatus Neomarinimicrobiota bacterium]
MIEALVGVVVGFLLAVAYDWNRRRRLRKAHWGMLGSEVSICVKRARDYLNRKVSAPLYRLPTAAFNASFLVLVGEADLSPAEFESLVEFYSWCEDINRGLDNADEVSKASDAERLQLEERRIHSKCEKLFSDYLEPAVETLKKHGMLSI